MNPTDNQPGAGAGMPAADSGAPAGAMPGMPPAGGADQSMAGAMNAAPAEPAAASPVVSEQAVTPDAGLGGVASAAGESSAAPAAAPAAMPGTEAPAAAADPAASSGVAPSAPAEPAAPAADAGTGAAAPAPASENPSSGDPEVTSL